MTYYSQAGEDKYINDELISLVPPVSEHYIEIGALDGVKYSNTKFLEETLGWSGVLVEPNPVSFEKLQQNRPQNTLIPSLISNQNTELEYSYYENENLAAVSGATTTLTEGHKKVFFDSQDEWLKKSKEKYFRTTMVKPISFDAVLQQSPYNKIGFCSIDVEGHELQVLQSYSFKEEISIFLIEINPNDDEIKELLESHQYMHYGSVAHNNVFLSREYYDLIQAKKLSNAA